MRQITTFLTIILAVLTVSASASSPWIPTQKNVVYEYESVNEKGKPQGYHTVTVKSVARSGNGETVTILSARLNKKRQSWGGKSTITRYLVTDDCILFLKESFGSGQQPESQQRQPEEGQQNREEPKVSHNIHGDDIIYPNTVAVGDKLPDYSIAIFTDYEGEDGIWNNEDNMSSVRSVRREIKARENVETAAGVFECWLLEEEIIYQPRADKTEYKRVLTWYAEEIGEVKVERYDDHGNITERYSLVAIKKLGGDDQ